jgi:hypothetical protein
MYTVVDNAFISPFNSQTMHIKWFYTQQHCYVSLKTLYPGGIWTRVFLLLRRMRRPLRHAARAYFEEKYTFVCEVQTLEVPNGENSHSSMNLYEV